MLKSIKQQSLGKKSHMFFRMHSYFQIPLTVILHLQTLMLMRAG